MKARSEVKPKRTVQNEVDVQRRGSNRCGSKGLSKPNTIMMMIVVVVVVMVVMSIAVEKRKRLLSTKLI
jgi:predicted metalloprotease